NENSRKFIGLESSDLKTVHETLRSIDQSSNYSKIGGALAFAVTIASMESASKSLDKPLFQILSSESSFKFPFPLGNILGGGAHAGPGTPDIQEILICAIGAKTIREAIETNLSVHKELRHVLEKEDPNFTNGRGDEGGWAPKLKNEKALELSAKACENLGFTLGKEVALGVDFASSTQWSEERQKYIYERAGFVNSPEQQIEFAANIIQKYKLIYAEDAVHEEAFDDMAELTAKFPDTLVVGDDLTVTNKDILTKAINSNRSASSLFELFYRTLKDQIGVENMLLFSKNGNDWEPVLGNKFISELNPGLVYTLLKYNKLTDLSELNGNLPDYLKQYDILIPVFHKDNPLAYLLMSNPKVESYEPLEDKIKFAQTVTNIITVAIENKRLFKKETETLAFQKELEVAAQVQNMLIPHNLPINDKLQM
ncbi:MAG: hypothetical protein Q7R33_08325, partial [Nitrosarchaeum sp.]|nr:hypothetical protein [Nitrosarchaeum sp.]